MTELNVEHVLMLAIVAFVLYHFMGSCGCRGNGFSVGGPKCPDGMRKGSPNDTCPSGKKCEEKCFGGGPIPSCGWFCQ